MQILKFISDVLTRGSQPAAVSSELAELHMLWQILQLLCQHKGNFRSADVAVAKLDDKRPGELVHVTALVSCIIIYRLLRNPPAQHSLL